MWTEGRRCATVSHKGGELKWCDHKPTEASNGQKTPPEARQDAQSRFSEGTNSTGHRLVFGLLVFKVVRQQIPVIPSYSLWDVSYGSLADFKL